MIPARILDQLAERLTRELAPPASPLVPLLVGTQRVGALEPSRAKLVARWPDIFDVTPAAVRIVDALAPAQARSETIECVVRALYDEGRLTRWRGERYAVSATPGAAPLFSIERAAARFFGIATHAVHVNGIVGLGAEEAMWIARRSPDKAIDPGLLDNLVGGGIPADAGTVQTLVKEAFEEAGIPAELASCAAPVGRLRIRRLQPDGLQDETIHVHDLWLPGSFLPRNQDGEVAGFELVSPQQAALYAAGSDAMYTATADASLVIADWLLRHGELPHDSGVAQVVARSRVRVS